MIYLSKKIIFVCKLRNEIDILIWWNAFNYDFLTEYLKELQDIAIFKFRIRNFEHLIEYLIQNYLLKNIFTKTYTGCLIFIQTHENISKRSFFKKCFRQKLLVRREL